MKIILKDDVKNLGSMGDVVNVADGYARNYLFPKKFAMASTPENLNAAVQLKKLKEKKMKKQKEEAELFAKRLEEVSCTITKKVGENEKLFGSVTSKDIVENLQQQKIEIEKKDILLANPIKSLGIFKVSVKLHPEVTAELKVWIVKE